MSICRDDPALRATPPSADDGFTLIETLVALAIFAAAFAGLFRAFDSGWRGLRLAALEAEAVEVAKSRLMAAGIEVPLSEGRVSGATESGVAWELDIRRRDAGDARPSTADAAPRLFSVTVRAFRRTDPGATRPAVELSTIKLGSRS